MSILAKKLEEEVKQKKTGFLLVSETLELISKATDSPIDDVKEYLLFNNIDIETPVYHYQGGRRFEVLETSRPDGYFTGTRKALKEPLEGDEYFLIDDLKQLEPLSEYDIFAYQRGYYYIAKQAIGHYVTGDKIPLITDDELKAAVRKGRTLKGLTTDRAEFLLSKGAIEKLYIKDIEAKQSRQVQSLTKQVEYLQAQLKAEREVETEKPVVELGRYQKLLIKYPLFTAHQIACLLADLSPVGEGYNNDHDYKLYKELTDIAIDVRSLTIFNDKGQIPSEQVKVWLARLDFIYKGFNDDVVEYLNDEGDSLKRSSDEFAGRIDVNNQTIHERDEEIEQLAADYEELRLEYEEVNRKNKELLENIEQYKQNNSEELTQHWEAESKKYKTKIEDLETQLKQSDGYQKEIHASSNMLEFDWYNLDRAVYPPELHLAWVIWQRIYQDNESLRLRLNSHNSRFEVIAGKLGLDPSSALGKRINRATNPAAMKMGQYALAKQLYDIKTLNMPALLTKNPK